MTSLPLVEVNNVHAHTYEHTLIDSFSMAIKEGEHTALLGGVASGKTSVLKLLSGKLPVREGSITYYSLGKQAESAYLFQRDHVALVTFEPQFLNQESYYQQRFNSTETDDLPKLNDYIKHERDAYFDKIATLLNLHELLPRPLITLSSGQMRKALIAQALLRKPTLLLLDNPFAGLDATARDTLKELLRDICDALHMTLILACSRREEIPEHVKKVVELPAKYDISSKASLRGGTTKQSHPDWEIAGQARNDKDDNPFTTAVEFTNVHVAYGEKTVLDNVNFCIRRGEKWALLGRNGAGKSTMMSLIYGDHPQAYANQITLFDRPKGSGESIWEIKQRVGYCSSELHAYFREPLTCFEVICTGFNSTFIPKRNLSNDEQARIGILLEYYDAIGLKERNFLQVSSGEQRLVLLLRALVRNADMLILDEPFQCFDDELVEFSKLLIDKLSINKTLLFTSHYRHEIPSCVSNIFQL